MKKLYTIACMSIIVLTAQAQTFSPALKSNGTNVFTYNFSQVKRNESKQINFAISGVPNGTVFNATIDQELDYVEDIDCGISYGNPNFVITSGESGVITSNKGAIVVTFNPIDFEYLKAVYVSDWDGDKFGYCETAYQSNYGTKTATMTVTLYTPNATNYTLNLSGSSVDAITALPTNTKAKPSNASLFYPNPVNDVLVLNQEATIYDAFGKVILSGKGSMDVSKIHSGVYYVQSAGQTQKFIKE